MINALMQMFGFSVGEAAEIESFADENDLMLDEVVVVLNIKEWKL